MGVGGWQEESHGERSACRSGIGVCAQSPGRLQGPLGGSPQPHLAELQLPVYTLTFTGDFALERGRRSFGEREDS